MFLEIDGLKIFYNIEGEGNPLVLLHGWGASSDTLYSLFYYFKKKYLVINLDLPGFGKSDTPNRSFDGEDYKKIILKFINNFKLKNFTIIGHSFGGRIGIRIASENPLELKSLILIDSAGIREKKTNKQKVSETTFKILKKITLKIFKGKRQENILDYLRNIFGSSDYKMQKGIMRDTLVKIVNEDLTTNLKKIKIKTLIIWGEEDIELPVTNAHLMHDLIKNSKLVIIKNAGHFPFLDDTTRVLNSIELFLEEIYRNVF